MADLNGIMESILLPVVAALGAWNAWLTKKVIDTREQVVGQYHSKAEIDALCERMMKAVGEQIKHELMPVRFRLREIARALKLPPEITEDDPE